MRVRNCELHRVLVEEISPGEVDQDHKNQMNNFLQEKWKLNCNI